MAFFAPNGLLGSTSTLLTSAEGTVIGGISTSPVGLLANTCSEGKGAPETEGLASGCESLTNTMS